MDHQRLSGERAGAGLSRLEQLAKFARVVPAHFMNRSLFLALLLCLSVAACNSPKGKWLHGTWTFDAEYTKQKLAESKSEANGKSKDLIDGLKDIASEFVTPQLVGALEGSQLRVTDKEIVTTTKDGNGKVHGYEVVDAPDANTLVVKQSDGEVNTYHREGDRFWLTSTGTVNIRAYFRRAK